MSISLILVDDHEVVRSGLRMLLASDSEMEILAEAGSAAEALDAVTEYKPEVVLMDIGLPDMSGIEATRAIKELEPETAVVALTIHEDEEYFFRMLEAGASGYVPKRAAPEELITAIRVAAEGEVYLYPSLAKLLVKDYLVPGTPGRSKEDLDGLTDREQEVLAHLADGASNLDTLSHRISEVRHPKRDYSTLKSAIHCKIRPVTFKLLGVLLLMGCWTHV
jgi:two-component system response regulator NreC